MNDLPGRGDVNPYGIPVPNPHEQEDPEWCVVCGEMPAGTFGWCTRCERNMEEDRMRRETDG